MPPVDAFAFFLVLAAVSIGSAAAMVLSAKAVHSALFLLLNLFSLSVLFLTLSADFLFAVQIIIYAGAIVVLFMFVITLLNPVAETRLRGGGRTVPVLVFAGALLVELLLVVRRTSLPGAAPAVQMGTAEIGELLFTRYLFPFEAVSLLLLVAVVSAIVLAKHGRRMAGSRPAASSREEVRT